MCMFLRNEKMCIVIQSAVEALSGTPKDQSGWCHLVSGVTLTRVEDQNIEDMKNQSGIFPKVPLLRFSLEILLYATLAMWLLSLISNDWKMVEKLWQEMSGTSYFVLAWVLARCFLHNEICVWKDCIEIEKVAGIENVAGSAFLSLSITGVATAVHAYACPSVINDGFFCIFCFLFSGRVWLSCLCCVEPGQESKDLVLPSLG